MRKLLLALAVLISFAGSSCTEYTWGGVPPFYWEQSEKYDVVFYYTDTDYETKSVKEGKKLTVPENGRTVDGKVFTWWKDTNGNQYLPGDSITVNSDMVLVAEWINNNAPVTVDGTEYDTVADVIGNVADGSTIDITESTTTGGFNILYAHKYGTGLTFDLNGNTLMFNTAVGSIGTESQGLHLEHNCKVVVNDGILAANNENIGFLINTYGDLTLSGVTLVPGPSTQILLNVNFKLVKLNNGTTFMPISEDLSPDGAVAEVFYWPPDYAGEVGLIIETSDVVLNGKLRLERNAAADPNNDFMKNMIIIIPEEMEEYMNETIVFSDSLDGYTYQWIPCTREGYKEGYLQLQFVAES